MNPKKILELLIVTDIYASLISIAVPFISSACLGLPFDLLIASLVFFQSLSIYALNRQVDKEIDAKNNPNRTTFVLANGRTVLAFALLGFSASMFLAMQASIPLFLLLSANFIASIFYSFPLLPKKLGFTRFKELLIGKNLCVGAMYAVYALAPVFYAGAPISAGAQAIFLFILARFFIVSTVFDMRDVEGDAQLKIRTIPSLFGMKSTLLWLHMINAASLLLAFLCASGGMLPPSFALAASATSLFAFAYLLECGRKMADLRFICCAVAEADIIPAALIALLLMH